MGGTRHGLRAAILLASSLGLALAGGLMAYSRSHKLEDLPAYSHLDPGPAFARLVDILRDLLDTDNGPTKQLIEALGEKDRYWQYCFVNVRPRNCSTCRAIPIA